MAIRALPGKVVGRRLMASGTIRQTRMIKVGITKIARILMARAASASKVVGRGTMAG
jgi:hypothetical protein